MSERTVDRLQKLTPIRGRKLADLLAVFQLAYAVGLQKLTPIRGRKLKSDPQSGHCVGAFIGLQKLTPIRGRKHEGFVQISQRIDVSLQKLTPIRGRKRNVR